MTQPLQNERGVVLLVVLILVSLLSAVAINLAHRQVVDLRLVEAFRDSTRAHYIARGGLEAAAMILRMDKNSYDAPDETWAQPIQSFPVGEEGSVDLTMRSLDGLIDLNRLVTAQGNIDVIQRDRFLRLLEALEIPDPDSRAATLIDWLDPDDDVTAGGAESRYYLSQEIAYPARNGPMETLDELRRLRGFTEAIVSTLTPHVTLYGSYAINLNTATREVVLALHQTMTDSEWEKLEERRQQGPIRRVEDIRDISGWDPIYISIKPQLAVKSDNYQVDTTGRVGRGVRRMTAVYKKSAQRLLAQRAY